jgi:hypothetical protein
MMILPCTAICSFILRSLLYPSYPDLCCASQLPIRQTQNPKQRERMMRRVNTRPVWTKVGEPFPLCVYHGQNNYKDTKP